MCFYLARSRRITLSWIDFFQFLINEFNPFLNWWAFSCFWFLWIHAELKEISCHHSFNHFTYPFLFNVAEKAQNFSIMKTWNIKGYLIFMVWISWRYRKLFRKWKWSRMGSLRAQQWNHFHMYSSSYYIPFMNSYSTF